MLKTLKYAIIGTLFLLCSSCASLSGKTCTNSCTDDDITTAVQKKINNDRCMSDQFIVVDTYEREVTLTGHVSNPTQLRIVKEMARSVPGVRGVNSKLTIVPTEY